MVGFTINVIGAESTGKTTLCEALKQEYILSLIPEYARIYTENLDHKTEITDIKHIGNQQLTEFDKVKKYRSNCIFDTTVITSIIWLYDKFKTIDLYLHKAFLLQEFNITLLCVPDIPWAYDKLREDQFRQLEIHTLYKDYLELNNKKFYEIVGFGEERTNNAKKIIDLLI
jgi:nicotinamide riboside kinase